MNTIKAYAVFWSHGNKVACFSCWYQSIRNCAIVVSFWIIARSVCSIKTMSLSSLVSFSFAISVTSKSDCVKKSFKIA
jgi:hypothetical protein